MRTPPRPLLAVAGWFTAAAVATTIGVVAVGAIGTGIVGATNRPLTPSQVDQALVHSTQGNSALQSPASASGGTDSARVLSTAGGTLLARCADGRAALLSWSPAQGYEAEDIHRGPATRATLQFESDDAEIDVRVTCQADIPTSQATARSEHD